MIDDTRPDGDRRTGTFRFQHDGEGSISTSVVLAIAELDGVDPTEMELLYAAVDPDLLDAVHRSDRPDAADVAFDYRGYRVTVDSDGGIVVRGCRPDAA